jgi:hypothetical protein
MISRTRIARSKIARIVKSDVGLSPPDTVILQ